MKFEIISTSYRGAVRKLFPKLRGRVFHITSPENFMSICKSGEIRNNKDGSLKTNWSNGYYFATKGCVSVCDLVNNTKPRVTRSKCLSDYQIFGQSWGPTTVVLFLSPSSHDRLITWHTWKLEKAFTRKVVPGMESGFPNSIPLSEIEEIWFINIKDREWLWNPEFLEKYARIMGQTKYPCS